MGLVKLYFGKLFDERGEHLKDVYFSKFNKTFKFKDKSFNIKLKEASHFDNKGLIIDKRYYIYNVGLPDPILLNKKQESLISPEDYNSLLETNQLKKLNDVGKRGLLDLLNPKVIIGLLVLIGAVYLLSTGQIF